MFERIKNLVERKQKPCSPASSATITYSVDPDSDEGKQLMADYMAGRGITKSFKQALQDAMNRNK